MKALDSDNFSKDDLDKIINAFYDIADVVDSNDFASDCGVTDESSPFGSVSDSKSNFVAAKNIIYHNNG